MSNSTKVITMPSGTDVTPGSCGLQNLCFSVDLCLKEGDKERNRRAEIR